MRKQILFLLVMFALSIGCKAEQVTLAASNRPETTLTPQYPKAPARPLTVDITGHTLTFYSAFEDVVTVTLLDEDENVVYTDWLAPGQTSLTFPDTLSGVYTIQILWGNRAFEGIVKL